MAQLRYYFPDTAEWWIFGPVEGVDTTGMPDATALPADGATQTAINIEAQVGDKAIPLSGAVFRIGGSPGTGGGNTNTAPGAPASVVASLSGSGIVVHAQAPGVVGVPPYHSIVVGVDGSTDQNPVIAPTGEATFSDLPPGVYVPWAYAFGGGGVGPTMYGASVTIAGSGVPPVISGVPAILGSARYDSILTATLPSATGAASSSIQWLRNGTPISAAISNTYRLGAADVGAAISVRVTFVSSDGSIASATSAATAAVAKGIVTAIRMPTLLAFDGSTYVEATGVVGQQHAANAGDYTPYPGGAGSTEAHELWIDGVQVATNTHGWTGSFWTPQSEDLGKTAVYIQRFTGYPVLADSSWPSLGVKVSSASASLTSVTVANTSPAQGLMATIASIGGASAAAGTSATITARTDAGATGGIGVFEMTQTGLTAWEAGDYTTAAANQVMASDIGAYAPGTTVQLGPFSAGTVALVFKPIGSGTYSYTLGLGSGTATPPQGSASALLFNDGAALLLNSGEPIEVIAQ